MAGRIYSVGYEGASPEWLVEQLVGAGVSLVVDVRLNPTSRRPGFSRRQLEQRLARVGIGYVHEKSLGNPADNRESFRSGDGEAGRERMRAILSNGASAALSRIIALASTERIALLCVERDHSRCHRRVITEMALERNPDTELRRIL